MWLCAAAAILSTLAVLLASLRVAFGDRLREGVAHLGIRGPVVRGVALGIVGSPVMAAMSLRAVIGQTVQIEWMDLVVFLLVVAPIVEELMYRAFICELLHGRARMGVTSTCVMSAVVFAGAHMIPPGVLEADVSAAVGRDLLAVSGWQLAWIGATGAYLSWVYLRINRSIWTCAIMHALHNVAVFGMGDLGDAAAGAMHVADMVIGSQVLLWLSKRQATLLVLEQY